LNHGIGHAYRRVFFGLFRLLLLLLLLLLCFFLVSASEYRAAAT
jgi:hypothetical protein